MYLEHFGLSEQPFRLTPDSRFLYLSKAHAQAKAYMEYTIWNRDSFVVITGEIGCGKTTLIQKVLENMDEDVIVAKIHQTQLTEVQFLQALLAEFGIKAFKSSKVQTLNKLNEFLAEKNAEGKRVVLIVDEAQNLSAKVLEEVRLLSGLETARQANLNVVLAGQPELNDTLDSQGMEQLVQRVRLRFHLGSLTMEEMREYINHRIHTAGLPEGGGLFSEDLMPTLFEYTHGIPRLINTLCDTALTCAYVDEVATVTPPVLETAINELQWVPYDERAVNMHQRKNGADKLPPGVGSMAKLVVKEEHEVIGEYLLHKESMTIGRNQDNDISIDDTVVSSYHARIITRGEKSYIYDLNSTNGTFVNAKPIRKNQVLKHGDVITITKYKLKYRVDESLGEDLSATGQRKMWRDTLKSGSKAANDAANIAKLPSKKERVASDPS